MPMHVLVRRLVTIVPLVAVLIAAPAAFAKAVACRDVNAALRAGKTVADVRAESGATQTRVEACQRIAADRARMAERREAFHQRRAGRTRNRD